MRKLTLGLAASATLIASSSMSVHAAEILVGVAAELTGLNANVGTQTARGIEVGVEWLNANHDMNGNTIRLMIEDNATDKAQSMTLLNKFALRDNVHVVVGTSSSILALSIAPRAEELQVPMITSAFAPAVVEGRKWVFKASDTPARMFQSIANYTADVLKPETCVRVYARDNEAYVEQSNVWARIVKEKGVEIVDEPSILLSDTDFTAIATRIVDLDPDCLHLAMTPETSANFVIQTKSAGLDPDTLIIGGTTMATGFFLDAAGEAAEGTYSLADYSPGGINELGKTFEAAYEAKFGEKPDNFSAVGFAEALVIGQAIKAAGDNPTRDSIREAMAGLKDVETIIGNGTLSMVDQMAQYQMNVLTVEDGQLVRAPGQ
ncbi:ABC transporter substrate-binding protein [Chelativorans sp. Marseille-P2723]|uniref:ABC transporter substrate-binding protein n=1 Tax=Chelativorans sp. Marseille-P2723 TaxID=2709133 RepID=UPI00156FE0D2|nr:ABC transporter substrate-binding protein [Chelativorans sp. Marseille-P2723]